MAEEPTSCEICCEDMKAPEVVCCKTCRGSCCRSCFCRYLLDSGLEPKCMFPNCQVQLAFDVLMTCTPVEWRMSEYKRHRTNLLMKQEDTKMEQTQKATKAYLTAQSIVAEQSFKEIQMHVIEVAEICIEKYAKGWEDFDFGNGALAAKPSKSAIRCPASNCLGFIDAVQWICNLCSSQVCEECHEVVPRTRTHRCDPAARASIKAIAAEAKPCPKCAALISKIDGCDQMFCEICHTTYSWLTGQLIFGRVHNPHYFKWVFGLRNTETIERLVPAEQQCEEYISYERLNQCFDTTVIRKALVLCKRLPRVSDYLAPLPSIAHYYLAFRNFRQGILHVRATSGNHANVPPVDNHDLRVRLQVNEITHDEMKEQVFQRDVDYQKSMAYCSVYLTVSQSATIIFDNLYAFTCNRSKIPKEFKRNMPLERFLLDSYLQLQRLLETANLCLEHNDQVYGSDERFVRFNRHPYSGQARIVDEDDQ